MSAVSVFSRDLSLLLRKRLQPLKPIDLSGYALAVPLQPSSVASTSKVGNLNASGDLWENHRVDANCLSWSCRILVQHRSHALSGRNDCLGDEREQGSDLGASRRGTEGLSAIGVDVEFRGITLG